MTTEAPAPIFMVRYEAKEAAECWHSCYFREKREMDGFIAGLNKSVFTITDIFEADTNTAESALEGAAEMADEVEEIVHNEKATGTPL